MAGKTSIRSLNTWHQFTYKGREYTLRQNNTNDHLALFDMRVAQDPNIKDGSGFIRRDSIIGTRLYAIIDPWFNNKVSIELYEYIKKLGY